MIKDFDTKSCLLVLIEHVKSRLDSTMSVSAQEIGNKYSTQEAELEATTMLILEVFLILHAHQATPIRRKVPLMRK